MEKCTSNEKRTNKIMEKNTSNEIGNQENLQKAKEEAMARICLLLNNQPNSVKGEREHSFDRHLKYTQGIEGLERMLEIYETGIKNLNQHERN